MYISYFTRGLLFGLTFLFQPISADDIRALYLFKSVTVSNTTGITTSGFNSLVIFGVGVIDNGDIMYYSNTPNVSDVLVASNGVYVGGSALSSIIQGFKTATGTNVNRVEICMNSENIQTLMAASSGNTTNIYKNFAALKAAWTLDAVNNDDESIYDISSTVAFAKMLGAIGYTYTTCPYTNTVFWVSLKTQLGALQDRTYLQCYDGGAGNNPATWKNELGMDIVPLLWVTNEYKPADGSTSAQAETKFKAWETASTLAGGGYWNDYDIEQTGSSYTAYGNALLTVFP